MMLSGRDVPLVGRGIPSAQNLTARLQSWGLQCHFVDDLRSARKRLVDRPVDLVLSDTHLADGTGFSLLSTLVGCRSRRFSACRSRTLVSGCQRSMTEKSASGSARSVPESSPACSKK